MKGFIYSTLLVLVAACSDEGSGADAAVGVPFEPYETRTIPGGDCMLAQERGLIPCYDCYDEVTVIGVRSQASYEDRCIIELVLLNAADVAEAFGWTATTCAELQALIGDC